MQTKIPLTISNNFSCYYRTMFMKEHLNCSIDKIELSAQLHNELSVSLSLPWCSYISGTVKIQGRAKAGFQLWGCPTVYSCIILYWLLYYFSVWTSVNPLSPHPVYLGNQYTCLDKIVQVPLNKTHVYNIHIFNKNGKKTHRENPGTNAVSES